MERTLENEVMAALSCIIFFFKTFKALNVKKFDLTSFSYFSPRSCAAPYFKAVQCHASDQTLCKIGFRGLIQKAGNFENTHYSKKHVFHLRDSPDCIYQELTPANTP
jgi:hypothetical protein